MNADSNEDWSRDFRLNGYPTLPNGQMAEYGRADYLAWLADYLFEAVIEPKAGQTALCRRLRKTNPAAAMRVIGAHAGNDACECEEHPYYRFPENFEPDSDPSNLPLLHPEEEPLGDEMYVDPSVMRDFVARELAFYHRYQSEMREFKTLWPNFEKQWNYTGESRGQYPEPTDAGWRILLMTVLKREPDKQLRIQLLELFFDEFVSESAV